MILNTLAKAISYFASEYVFIAIITYGFFCLKKDNFSRAIIVMLFSIILTHYLKSIWKIPLPPLLNKDGWAFPSGHMMTLCSFWLWLAYEYKNKIFFLLVVGLISLVGWSITHLNYHYPTDIYGAVFFSVLLLSIHKILLYNVNLKIYQVGFMYSLIGIALIFLTSTHINHFFNIEGALIGFSLGLYFQTIFILNTPQHKSLKILLFILATKSIITIMLLSKILIHTLPEFLLILEIISYFAIAIWISFISELLYHLLQNFYNYCKKRKNI